MSFSFVIHLLGTVQTSRIFYHSKMLHFTTEKAFRDVVSLLSTFILAKQTVFIYVEVRSLLQMSWGAIHKNTCNSTFMLKKPGPICYQIKFVIPFIWVEKYMRKNYPCFFPQTKQKYSKPNESERRILKLSCYVFAENPKSWRAFSMFRNASSQNEFRFDTITYLSNLVRCMTETSPATQHW